jgi:hypothetical protein
VEAIVKNKEKGVGRDDPGLKITASCTLAHLHAAISDNFRKFFRRYIRVALTARWEGSVSAGMDQNDR